MHFTSYSVRGDSLHVKALIMKFLVYIGVVIVLIAGAGQAQRCAVEESNKKGCGKCKNLGCNSA